MISGLGGGTRQLHQKLPPECDYYADVPFRTGRSEEGGPL